MGDNHMTETVRKRLAVVRRLDHYKDFTHRMLVKVDIDYSKLVRRFNEMHYSMPVYICEGDKILYSTEGYTDLITPFAKLDKNADFAYENDFELYGLKLRILVSDSERDVFDMIKSHFPLLILLLSVNILLPTMLMYMINISFTDRLRTLSSSFDNVNNDMS